MESETSTAIDARETRPVPDVGDGVRLGGALLVAGAVAFFLGSGVLTRSGTPGASTPVPWMVSHALWFVATTLVTVGTATLVGAIPALRTGLAGYLASGSLGLGVLHALQWTAWVYVDVMARRTGGHELLLDPLLHPFGTAHALMYGVLVGGGVAFLGWGLAQADPTHRYVDRTGVVVGATTVLVATVSLLLVAPVRSPPVLAVIALLAVVHGWVFLVGVAVYRKASVVTDADGSRPRPDSRGTD